MLNDIKNNGKPAAGRLLISEPFLPDTNFKRAVVLLCEYNDKGCLGFILNRKLKIDLYQALNEDWAKGIPLYLGGPVQNDTLHFIHRYEGLVDKGEKIGEGLYWGGDHEEMKAAIKAGHVDKKDYRFFLGYSGWGADQLKEELEAKSWILADADTATILEGDKEMLWKKILEGMGGKFKMLANYPESPFLN